MFSFDSLSLKYFFKENFSFINGAIIQKIQLPSRYEVVLNIRNLNQQKAENKKLYININPKYPHICFINEKTSKKRNLTVPKQPPMFCMQLRKYLNGSKIKDFKLVQYERILELYFDYFDEIGSLTKLCLSLEFMGKHSNIILYNVYNKTIIGSIHNISADKSSVREIYGGIKYIYPPIKNKLDLLKTSYSTFFEIAQNDDIKEISNNFYYFNQALLKYLYEKKYSKEDLYKTMQLLQNGDNKELLCSFWGNENLINSSIDEYFSNIMFEEILNSKKIKLKKYLQNTHKKLVKISSINFDYSKVEKYKEYADLIMCNLYNLEQNTKEVVINGIKIKLDENLNLSENAQKYYSLYKKEKTAFEYQTQRKQQSLQELEYYDSILFNIENSNSFEELSEIKNELIDLELIKNTKKEEIKSNINKFEFKGFEIYLGKNNKQNDYLISKIANSEDLWFHGLNFPSSHVILKIPNNKKAPNKEVLEFCANLVKQNSKAKNSGKTSIIMTKRKNLKKPPNTYLGYVTYKNETEIVI